MIRHIFPFLSWEKVTQAGLKADIYAGLTVALCLIPQSMAYAELAGLPPWIGLYASVLPVIIAALWGSSNQLQTGPVAMISLLTATTLAPLTFASDSDHIIAASVLAMIVGVAWILIGVTRLTFVVNFISKPVVEGFVNAGALIIAFSQVKNLLGSQMSGVTFSEKIGSISSWDAALHLPTAAIGIISLIILIALKKYAPKFPGALLVVTAMTGLVYAIEHTHGSSGIQIIGDVPRGLPSFSLPTFNPDSLGHLAEGAIAIVFIGFLEMSSIARAIAVQSRQNLNLNQEVIAQGLSSIVSSFSGSYPVSGSFSRTALNHSAGAKSPLAAVFTGVFVLIAILFATPLLYFMPKAALAAIIISAVIRLFNPRVFIEFWKMNKMDGVVLMVTFVATLAFAPHLDRGILLGVILSSGVYLYRMMKKYAVLFSELHKSDLTSLSSDDTMPIVHFGGSLSFTNSTHIEDALLDIAARFRSATHICVDCTGISDMDISIVKLFENQVKNMRLSQIELIFAGFRPEVKGIIEKSRLYRIAGKSSFYPSVWDAKEEIQPECLSGNYYII